jgi:hypothetical protein
LSGGTLTTTGTTFSNSGTITTAGGNVDIQNTGNVTIGAAINAGAGDVDIDGGAGVATSIIDGGGTITSSGTITFEASGSIGVVAGTIDTAGTGAISASSTNSDIYIDNTGDVTDLQLNADSGTITFANIGSIDTGAAITANAIRLTSSGTMTIDQAVTADSGTVALSGALVDIDAQISATGSIDLTASANIDLVVPGNFDNIISAGSGDVTLNASGDIVVANNANVEVDTSGSVSVAAQTIGDSTGNEQLHLSGPSALNITQTGQGDVDIEVTGGDVVNIDDTISGVLLNDVSLTDRSFSYTATSGNILVHSVDAGTADVTITASVGAINEATTEDVDVDITADSISLNAATGIGAVRALELEVANLSAATTNGNIDLDNTNVSAVELTNVSTTGAGANITFDQTGGGVLTLTSVTTTDGTIDISADSGNIIATSVTAGTNGDILLDTATSGDITLGSLTAADDNITINSAGAIDDAAADAIADLIAGELDLDAVDGIGTTAAIETVAATIDADTTGNAGHIDIDKASGSATELTSVSTTGTGANITFDQTGGGALTLTSVTTTDGTIDVSADSGNIAATLITAGTNGDILLDTTTSGDITLGSLTAADDKIIINSAGAIDDAAVDAVTDLTSNELDLDAVDGIGATATIETVATMIDSDTTGNAAHIDIDNATGSATELTSVSTTGTGANVTFDQSGGGALMLTSVTTTDGTINVSADSGNIIATLVTAGTNGDILLDTTTSGDITLGSLTATNDRITINSAGAIDDAEDDAIADLTAGELDLDAVDGIGLTSAIETAATTIDADTTGNAARIDMDNTTGSSTELTSVSTTGAGANVTFDQSGGGTLTLTSVTTTDGTINISADSGNIVATLVTAGTNGDILLDTTTAGDITLSSLTAGGSISLEATAGTISQGAGIITANGGSVAMTSAADLNMINYNVANPGSTDLTLDSTGGSVTSTAADDWQSITATANGNITLSGTSAIREIKTGALTSIAGNISVRSTDNNLNVTDAVNSALGGVSLIADNGKIYTSGDTLNISITGYSVPGTGVDLLMPGGGTGAIVIRSAENLTLGPNATLTANGAYDPVAVGDDRYAVGFEDSISGGDPIDVAIYLRSNRPDALLNPIGNVTVESKVTMDNNGTMVVDAGERVAFGGKFYESVFNQTNRLEVVSRRSTTLNEVITYDRLPYADDPEAIRNAFAAGGGSFTGAYVLRGVRTLLAEILGLTNPVPLAPPRPLEPEVGGEVEGPDTEALASLLSELGIGVQPYVTEAYADSLSTDLRLYSAAEKLQQLIPILEDADGTRIAGLRAVAARFFPSLDVLSEEQMYSFAEELARHKGDGTNYDLAGQCIYALTEYVNILGNDIGWPVDKSVGFVMSRYVPRLTEGDEIRIAIIQMQLQKTPGV